MLGQDIRGVNCGALRHLRRQDAGVDVDDEPGAAILRADVGVKTDRVLPRPIEQRVAIGNANPSVIAAATRVTAIDDPLGLLGNRCSMAT